MRQYQVSGMSCAACSARVEKAVSGVEGVNSCSVNLLTNSMVVEGTATSAEIIKAVERAGYGASATDADAASVARAGERMIADEERSLKHRLLWSVGILVVLLYISMGHMMWSWPLPAVFERGHFVTGMIQLVLTSAIIIINRKFFTSGVKSLVHGAPNMDTLVALGAGAAYIWSIYVLAGMHQSGEMGDLYFESAGTILTLITVGKMLEARSKGNTTNALKSLMDLAPKTAIILKNGSEANSGEEFEVPIADVAPGDIFLLRPGASVPVDGIVLEGDSAIDESALTGESMPADKHEGSEVFAGTINSNGFLKCRAMSVGEDTSLAKIIETVSQASAGKAPIAKIADRVAGVFVPIVIAVAFITFIVWFFVAKNGMAYSLERAISVLVISCPCALGLATPVAIMVASGVGAKNGILFKTAEALEETGKASIVVLDKTGTVTTGEPRVTDVVPATDVAPEFLIGVAKTLEKRSEHPLAHAIMMCDGDDLGAITEYESLPGKGLRAKIDGKEIIGGNFDFVDQQSGIPAYIAERAETLQNDGRTCLFFLYMGTCIGFIAVADALKEDSAEAIAWLRELGLKTVMLTGDSAVVARNIAGQVGVEEVVAGVLPDGKENEILSLQNEGKVIMVGDGINDAPALTRADIGIAIGAGTDIALDAADVVLVKSRPVDIPAAIKLGRQALRNIKQNLFWAFIYNIIGIPLAAGVLIPRFGIAIGPMFAAAAMSLSSVCVVSNALRLNFFNVHHNAPFSRKHQDGVATLLQQDSQRPAKYEKMSYNTQIDGKNKVDTKVDGDNIIKRENKKMQKTIKIDGMMCAHCEATVKKALEAIVGEGNAVVSHENDVAVVTVTDDVSIADLTKAIEDNDYKVISIN